MSLRFDFVTECALLVANDAHSGSMVRNLYSMVRVAEAPQSVWELCFREERASQGQGRAPEDTRL